MVNNNNNKDTSNFNIKKKKERNKKDILLKKNSDKTNYNGNNLKTHLMLNKININNDYFKQIQTITQKLILWGEKKKKKQSLNCHLNK